MTKKFLIAAGSVVLAVSAFLTTNANRKFNGAISAYFKTAGSSVVTLFKNKAANTSNLTTVKANGIGTAFIAVGGVNKSSPRTLFKSNSSGSLSGTLFFK